MFNKFDLCYNDNTNTLTIEKNIHKNIVHKIEGKYGIEIWCDINETPILIIIPDADVLLGIHRKYLLQLACDNFT